MGLWKKIRSSFFVYSIACLVWFIFRTGSKPSRIAYPCQKAAASQSLLLAVVAPYLFRDFLQILKRKPTWAKMSKAMQFLALGGAIILLFSVAYDMAPAGIAGNRLNPAAELPAAAPGFDSAATTTQKAAIPVPDRVVAVHDSNAAWWYGQNADYWNRIDQSVVDEMVYRGLKLLTGTSNVSDAWEALIPNYQPHQKIAIKVNNNNVGFVGNWPSQRDEDIDAIIEPVNAIVKSLFDAFGTDISGDDIWVYESYRTFFGASFMDKAVGGIQFYCAHVGGPANTHVTGFSGTGPNSVITFRYDPGTSLALNDVIVNADYLINIPIVKKHSNDSSTLGFKNHYGSIDPNGGLTFDASFHSARFFRTNNNLVDICYNPNIKDKTVLIVGDAIIGTKGINYLPPSVWSNRFPTQNTPEMLFFSCDPVAIDSVMADLLLWETGSEDTELTRNYMLEASDVGLGTMEIGSWSGSTYQNVEITYNDIDFILYEYDGQQTYYVPDDFATIQEALDAASAGNTIVVRDGLYTGFGNKNLDFLGKAITLRSENGPDGCVIDCEGDGRGFYFHNGETSNSIVDGFTISNGGAISYGAGINCEGASPNIINCVIAGNEADYDGGGIRCASYAGPRITNCTIVGNKSDYGGGIFCSVSSSATIAHCTISGNQAVDGGAIYCSVSSSGVVVNSILWDNTATLGPEIVVRTTAQPSSLTVSHCDVEGGQAAAEVASGCALNWLAGNIDADPLFSLPGYWAGPTWVDGDYHLTSLSPCIEAGMDAGVYSDIDGGIRPENSEFDIGSDELYIQLIPAISVEPTSISNSCERGANASSQSFGVWNSGWGTLSYSTSDDVGWLSCAPTSGYSWGEEDTIAVDYSTSGLDEGEYSATITVSDPMASNSPQTIEVNLTVLGVPEISCFPISLDNVCGEGENAPGQTFEVWNSGEQTLSYTISDNATWLSCNPTSGSSTGESDPISVYFSTSGLGAGDYSATIMVSDADAINDPQYISVSLEIMEKPEISVTPVLLSNSTELGENAPGQTFEVWNSGEQTLTYSISDNVTWLSCAPSSGSSGGDHDVIAVDYSTLGLGLGEYSATITISDPDASNSPQIIAVSLTVTQDPAISVSPVSLENMSGQGGDAPSRIFEVWNSGSETISYSISSSVGWLYCTPSSGSSAGEHDTITVYFLTSGLGPGSYTESITVTDPNAVNNPQIIPVTMTVFENSEISISPGSLTNSCKQGEDAPDQSFEVWNSGEQTLSYSISDNASWLYCVPTSGASAGEHDEIIVNYSTSGLGLGLHTATITITDPNAWNSPRQIPVNLTVTQDPAISLSAGELVNTVGEGFDAPYKSFEVWNSGGGTLIYSVSDNADWLYCVPTSGTSAGEPDVVTAYFATSSLAPGDYSASITVSDPNAINNPQQIMVSLTVYEMPEIFVAPVFLNNSCKQGQNAINQNFEVWNSGAQSLSYSISDNGGWLSCLPSGGVSSGEHDVITVYYETTGLGLGEYSAMISVSDPNASNSPRQIQVNLTVTENPAISVAPTSISNECGEGSDAPGKTLWVWNSGEETLSYTINDNVGWLSCSPTIGSSTGEHDPIAVQFSTSTLSAGDYSATISVSDPGAVNSPRQIPVSLTVFEPPEIARHPSSLSNSCVEGEDAPNQNFWVWNSSEQTLSYTISDDADWLYCLPTEGASTGEYDSITVHYSTLSLGAGEHTATITINDPEASNGPQQIAVSLTVGSLPEISFDPTLLANSCQQGEEAADQSFEIWNSGSGTLAYSISDNVSWLSCSPDSGQSEGESDTIAVNYSASWLGSGNHSATITISDPNAAESPKYIDVELTVAPPGLSQINLGTPYDHAYQLDTPSLNWSCDGGTDNVYAIDFSIPSLVPFWSTYNNMRILIRDTTWDMPPAMWAAIPNGWPVYWRVRGVDMDTPTRNLVISDEMWSFYKP